MVKAHASLLFDEEITKNDSIYTNISTFEFPSFYESVKDGSLTFETLSDKKVLKRLRMQTYKVFHLDDRVSYISETSEQGIKLRLDFLFNGILQVNFKFDYSINDRLLLLNSIEFIESLNLANQLRIKLKEVDEISNFDLPKFNFDVSKIKELISSIIIIETYSQLKLTIPDDYIEYINFLKIKIISQIIDTKLCLYRPIEIEMQKSDAIKLVESYLNEEKISPLVLNFRDNILNQQIIVENVILNLETVMPKGDLHEIYETFLNSNTEFVTVTFINITQSYYDIQQQIDSLKRYLSFNLQYRNLPHSIQKYLDTFNFHYFSNKIIYILLLKIHDYLDEKQIKHSFLLTVYTDPEEDLKLIMILINVEKDFSYIYEKLETPLYNLLDNNISKELARKIIVKIEPMISHD